jgi:predicted XRE-type DNA-binding protein
MKKALAAAINAKTAAWPQTMAAELLRTTQPRVSNLRNNKLDCFSLEKLVRMATRVRGYVTIIIDFRTDHLGPGARSTVN